MNGLGTLCWSYLLAFAVHQEPGGRQANDAGRALMQEAGATFRALEHAVVERDTQGFSLEAVKLRRALESTVAHEWPQAADSSNSFQAHARTATGVTMELAALGNPSTATEFSQASHMLEELRAACVQCHLRFRAEDLSRPVYPARRSAVTGQFSLRTTTGAIRKDSSNIVVFLDGGPDLELPLSRKRASISQQNREFQPRVLPVLRGTTVDFPNNDTVFHNVFSLSTTKPFDLGAYARGCCKSVEFSEPGLVLIHCNMHPQMVAHILVLENPYFTLTDETGWYALPEIPDGSYWLRSWHESGGQTKTQLVISGTSVLERSLEVQEQRTYLEHKNKFGQPYRDKY